MNPIDPPDGTQKIALVIGAAGGIGGEAAHALIAEGWRVRGLARQPDDAKRRAAWVGPVEWIAGDAMNEADVTAAAQGASVIFHGANPPMYRDWRGLAIPMLRNAIAAARASGARLIYSGNVYNFGPDAGAVIAEASPQHPLTRKGAIRVEMEAMLKAAANDGVRSLVLRAGDYFGPHQPKSWFRDVMVKPGAPLRSVTYPGESEVGPRVGLSARPCGDGGAPRRDRGVAAAVRGIAFRRPLATPRRRDGRGGPPGLRTAGFAHPPLSVGVDLCRRAVRDVFQRGDRDALPLARSASAR